MEEQLVLFELNGEMYGVSVAQVQSIIPMQEIVTVPGTPLFIEGVVNLRGAVVPVVNLRTRFNLSNSADKKLVIVVVELNDQLVGIIVDKVTEVTKISATAIEPPSPMLTSVDTAYLRGIGKIRKEEEKGEGDEEEEDRLVILLDLARVFSLEEQQTLVEAA